MLAITRTIHAVGQGAFFTEHFDFRNGNSFNVAYDCGSCWDGKAKSIDFYKPGNAGHPFLDIVGNHLKDSGSVDLLFISHFHSDHINGVKYLLDNSSRKVKLYVPWLSADMKLYFFLSNVMDEGGYNDGNGEYILWLLKFYFGALENAEKIEVRLEVADGDNGTHQSGKPVYLQGDAHPLWAFIPIVYVDSRLQSAVNEFIDDLKSQVQIADISGCINNLNKNWGTIEEVLSRHSKIRKEYANNLSLMLYSGPCHYIHPYPYRSKLISRINVPHYDNIPCNVYRKSSRYDYELPACLYVGDMEKAEACEEIIKQLDGLLYNIGMLQLSHHGDENPMNDALVRIYPQHVFCCYGTKNTYHHPGWKTVDEYMLAGADVFPVNEKTTSGITQGIRLYW